MIKGAHHQTAPIFYTLLFFILISVFVASIFIQNTLPASQNKNLIVKSLASLNHSLQPTTIV